MDGADNTDMRKREGQDHGEQEITEARDTETLTEGSKGSEGGSRMEQEITEATETFTH
jgi:hypothetical protein